MSGNEQLCESEDVANVLHSCKAQLVKCGECSAKNAVVTVASERTYERVYSKKKRKSRCE